MFNFLRSAKVDIDISPDRSFYQPGDTLHLHVTLKNNQPVKILRAHLRLRFLESCLYERERMVYKNRDHHTERYSQWTDNEEIYYEDEFLRDIVLEAHSVNTHVVDILIPPNAQSSCTNGKIIHTRWLCDVFIQTADKNRLHHEIPINVGRHPDEAANAIEFITSDHPRDVQLSLRLPSGKQVSPQAVHGEFRITAHHDFEADIIKVELTRRETTLPGTQSEQTYEVARLLINSSELNFHGAEFSQSFPYTLTKNVQFTGGETKSFPFEIRLGADTPPTIKTNFGSIRWTIKGVIERKASQRNFSSADEEIIIYPGLLEIIQP
ncbi:MAG: hypothetical protein LWX83_04700 [Anaerolineae bacterium]|nr:hypothetical protein [Anaerolineae bacterium]